MSRCLKVETYVANADYEYVFCVKRFWKLMFLFMMIKERVPALWLNDAFVPIVFGQQ